MVVLFLMYWVVGAFFIGLFLYYIIKNAVKNGVKQALYEFERERQ